MIGIIRKGEIGNFWDTDLGERAAGEEGGVAEMGRRMPVLMISRSFELTFLPLLPPELYSLVFFLFFYIFANI